MEIVILLVFLYLGVPFLLVKLGRLLPVKNPVLIFTVVCTLLLSPSLAPVTIMFVPAPLGVLLYFGVISGIGGMIDVVTLIVILWQFHLISIPTTAFIAYIIAKIAFESKNSVDENT
ncbi:MAG: hypothetical protein GKR91_12065 [Pseudomonadales bacterium]|nr:hypothetical protein [Pseudomonadales bacterium]